MFLYLFNSIIISNNMSDLSSSDYYKILGVSKNVTDTDLKKAYRKLALKWHPDKNQDKKDLASDNFKKIGEAYEVLSDSNKRKIYNSYGKAGLSGRGGGGGGHHTHHFSNANDIFKQFFQHQHDPFGQRGFHSMGSRGSKNFIFTTNLGGSDIDLGDILFGGGRQAPPPPQAKQRRRVTSNYILEEGTPIIINGLVKTPELNGNYGIVKDYSRERLRYFVEIDDSILALKPYNIVERVKNVRLTNIIRNPKFNDRKGNIVDWDDYKLRFKIKLDNGDTLSLKQNNIIFPKNTLVYIKNLENNVEYNNKSAKIVDYSNNKYILNINNRNIKLEITNVTILAPNH